MPLTGSDFIVPGAGILGAGINAWATAANNRKQRNWNWRMYQQERKDALSDYYMKNEYDLPKNQMLRFKEAGLNPNLIYGQMSEGATVRGVNAQSYNPEAPQVDLGRIANDSVASYYDTRIKAAQTDNLQKALQTADEQIRLTQAQTAATLANAASTELGIKSGQFDLALKESLRPLTLERAKHETDQAKHSAAYTKNQDIRAAQQNSATLKQLAATLLEIKARTAKTDAERKTIEEQRQLIEQSRELNELDLRLKRKGIQPSDNLLFRAAAQFIDDLNLKNFLEGLKRL